MRLEFWEEFQELRALVENLKENYGCTGLKMSFEDGGHSFEFVDFVRNQLLGDFLPFYIKVGGPDARTDIEDAIKIGASGIIGPMIESPFAVEKFVNAVTDKLGDKRIKQIRLSLNLESITAVKQIDEILAVSEIESVNEIIPAGSDLSKSVSKTVDDLEVLNMLKIMAIKSKKKNKRVRIGGVFGLIINNSLALKKLLEETGADEINTSIACFDVSKISNLKNSYLEAKKFENALMNCWVSLKYHRMKRLKKELIR